MMTNTISKKERTPFLVYGTLRPGCGNYLGLLLGKTTSEETVTLNGYEMWGATGCPFVMKSDFSDSSITGTLIYVEPRLYRKTRKSLDSLEGYYGIGRNNWYERILVDVVDSTGKTVSAWMYVVEGETAEHVKARHQLIESGDWLQHKQATRLS